MQHQYPKANVPIKQAFLPLTLIRAGGLPLSAWESIAQGMPNWLDLQKHEVQLQKELTACLDQALRELPEGLPRTVVYNARKTFFQHQKMSIPKVSECLRETVVWESWLECSSKWEMLQKDKQSAISALADALDEGVVQLRSWALDPVVRGGLLYASHDLLAQLDEFAKQHDGQTRKKDRKTAMTLLQYLSRVIFKTSPFSHFTTLSVQSLGSGSREELGQWFTSRATVTPNVALLPFLYDVLLKDPDFANQLTLRLNPSLQRNTDGEYTWLYFDGAEEAVQHMQAQPLVDYIWEYFSGNKSKTSFQQMSALILAETQDSAEAVNSWLNRLIDLGFLDRELPEKGLTASWCGGLYQYLGFYTTSAACVEVAFLLQWLRTTARTLPFQSAEMVMEMQRLAVSQLGQLLERHGIQSPSIPPEQVFYEDVFQDVISWIKPDEWSGLLQDLQACWHAKTAHLLPDYRAALVSFAQKKLHPGESLSFLDFCEAFMADEAQPVHGITTKRFDGKIGAVMQIYRENGLCKAVINGMYAGGGRMYSRWLNQMPPEEAQWVKDWMQDGLEDTTPFPFPGWSNVHFQPALANGAIRVPEERIQSGQARWQLDLKDLEVQLDQEGLPRLWDPIRQRVVWINDLGLESPDQLPAVRRVLWYLGVPYVSLEALLPGNLVWEDKGGLQYRPRAEFGQLVLSRATWLLPEPQWQKFLQPGQSDASIIRQWILQCHVWGLPRYFFGRFVAGREKPQMYDLQSPMSMSLLIRNLQKGRGGFLMTEMLPMPDQYPDGRVREYVVEFQVSE
ncbi:MAG: lantibiotic dehydratase [Chitinophagales bacterium]|nr:lantibiotic dehydratase [Chitinophagales bacterium]